MSGPSRQQKAFEKWKVDFMRLVVEDRKLTPDQRRDYQAVFEDMFSFPGIYENMIQAFSNFMWSMDEEIESQVNRELTDVTVMLAQTKAGKTDEGKALLREIAGIIESSDIETEDISAEEIAELTGEDDEDDAPINMVD